MPKKRTAGDPSPSLIREMVRDFIGAHPEHKDADAVCKAFIAEKSTYWLRWETEIRSAARDMIPVIHG
jgi:hypothetical protein